MIVDLNLGGVLIPGLLVLAFVALVATIAVIRLLSVAGIYRAFAYRPLVELATFAIIYGLLVQHLPSIGLLR
ncbi:DUF1656 domain-containing protein [Novosphingobium sp. RL4]|uniref:DUF1656 domain-containing protein n=1 Tax=Novosphingobium sp. RL4 TaxID=3109595 RepID=UPI002D78F509|nr:DUF1656 domain-containing protein [Novosphingobium sp. RL4]WRT91756.1 DUF1656 domain-containing protein [Novosphingobium sp. RL4]